MKKKYAIIATMLLCAMLFIFSGCGETVDLTEINQKIEDLQNDVNSMQDEISGLEQRIQRLESSVNLINTLDRRITALENAGVNASQFNQLKAQVQELQNDLTANTASDDEIKAQVTQMQLKLDEIYSGMEDGDISEVLSSIQSDINTLYGEVDRSVPFENGKEYEVKLNGVIYYTFSIIMEYHHGRVQSEQDIRNCNSHNLHWCGRIDIRNNTELSFTSSDARNMINAILDGKTRALFNITKKNGNGLDADEKTIAAGEQRSWYFTINPIATENGKFPDKFMDLIVLDKGCNVKLLILENIWDGVTEPIEGDTTLSF